MYRHDIALFRFTVSPGLGLVSVLVWMDMCVCSMTIKIFPPAFAVYRRENIRSIMMKKLFPDGWREKKCLNKCCTHTISRLTQQAGEAEPRTNLV